MSDLAADFGAVFLFMESWAPRVECMYCGLHMSGTREPVSHGVCPDCTDRARAEFGLQPKEEAP